MTLRGGCGACSVERGAGGVVTKTLRLEAAINPTPHMVVPRSSNLRATLFSTEK